jgi:hypothetical protein
MTVTTSEPAPVACTLGAGDFRQRLAWIADLNRDALRAQRRDGLRLELSYAPAALDRVREMVARERDCCAFLTFDLQQEADAVRLVIEAPDGARDALDAVFEPFEARESGAVCGCSSAGCDDPQR